MAKMPDCLSGDESSILFGTAAFEKMGKLDKKRKKLQERIDTLQEELRLSLTKKDSSTAEIDVASHQRKIQEAQKKLNEL